MYIVEKIKKNWYFLVFLLLTIAIFVYALFVFLTSGTILLLCVSGLMFGIWIALIFSELASSSIPKNRGSFAKVELLEELKDEEKQVDVLSNKLLYERQRFEELKRESEILDEELKQIRQSQQANEESDSFEAKKDSSLIISSSGLVNPQSMPPSITIDSVSDLENTTPKPSQEYTNSSMLFPSKKSAAVNFEIEETQKNISEKISIFNAASLQLLAEQDSIIAKLQTDIHALKIQSNNRKN